MMVSTPAELRADSKFARQMAAKEADLNLKVLWASHAFALAQLAEKYERSGELERELNGAMPPYEDLLRLIDTSKTAAAVAVVRERPGNKEVTLLKEQLRHLRAAFHMLEAIERERETRAHRLLDDAQRTSRAKTQLLAALGHDLRQPLTILVATLEMLEPHLLPTRLADFERAQTAAARLECAFAQVMEASQLDFGGTRPQISPFRIADL
jgi:K+-sensing histidine kinase KdpD